MLKKIRSRVYCEWRDDDPGLGFPNVDWMRQPWAILRQVTDPYLNLFRNLIPPIMGQIDFTPILGFMVLQFLAKVLSSDPSVGRF